MNGFVGGDDHFRYVSCQMRAFHVCLHPAWCLEVPKKLAPNTRRICQAANCHGVPNTGAMFPCRAVRHCYSSMPYMDGTQEQVIEGCHINNRQLYSIKASRGNNVRPLDCSWAEANTFLLITVIFVRRYTFTCAGRGGTMVLPDGDMLMLTGERPRSLYCGDRLS